jgi:phospholipase D1/2
MDFNTPPKNRICELLAKRINEIIISEPNRPFHVYITLPVHPEGPLDNGSIMTQVHWTMQSLVFGTYSLLNRIRRALKARELLDKDDPNWRRVYGIGNTEYETIDIKKCFDYVTLLNLRNWDKIGDRYVTEQIYVHSKLMIADDRFALVGSANINDRSLLGSRDSELAVLVMDSEVEKVNLCGDGKERPTRGFARKLRMEVWNKIFGITAGGDRAATKLAHAVDCPGDPKSWKAIQKVAGENTKLYEAAFDWIPRNKDAKGTRDPITKQVFSASIWPRWHPPIGEGQPWAYSGPMPFDKAFWSAPQFNAAAAAKLNGVKGFITLLPIDWTKGENNNIGYATALVVRNDRRSILPQPAEKMALNEVSPSSPEDKG